MSVQVEPITFYAGIPQNGSGGAVGHERSTLERLDFGERGNSKSLPELACEKR